MNISYKYMLGLSLFALLLVAAGPFLPTIDFLGVTMNWLDAEDPDTMLVIGLVVLSLPIIFFKQYRGLIITGLLVFGLTLFKFSDYQSIFGEAMSFMSWGALFLGSAILMVVGVLDFVKRRSGKAKNQPFAEATA